MDGYKHYLRVKNDIVIHGFSDAFEQPEDDDICILEDAQRHFHEAFPDPLINERGQYRYRWNGTQMVERSQTEFDAEWAARPPEPPSDKKRLEALEDTILFLLLGGM